MNTSAIKTVPYTPEEIAELGLLNRDHPFTRDEIIKIGLGKWVDGYFRSYIFGFSVVPISIADVREEIDIYEKVDIPAYEKELEELRAEPETNKYQILDLEDRIEDFKYRAHCMRKEIEIRFILGETENGETEDDE